MTPLARLARALPPGAARHAGRPGVSAMLKHAAR
jgi:hypothetical protein